MSLCLVFMSTLLEMREKKNVDARNRPKYFPPSVYWVGFPTFDSSTQAGKFPPHPGRRHTQGKVRGHLGAE